MNRVKDFLLKFLKKLAAILSMNVEFGKSISRAKDNSIIFLPIHPNTLHCGISALVAFKNKTNLVHSDIETLYNLINTVKDKGLPPKPEKAFNIKTDFLGGNQLIDELFENAQAFKQDKLFFEIFFNRELEKSLVDHANII